MVRDFRLGIVFSLVFLRQHKTNEQGIRGNILKLLISTCACMDLQVMMIITFDA